MLPEPFKANQAALATGAAAASGSAAQIGRLGSSISGITGSLQDWNGHGAAAFRSTMARVPAIATRIAALEQKIADTTTTFANGVGEAQTLYRTAEQALAELAADSLDWEAVLASTTTTAAVVPTRLTVGNGGSYDAWLSQALGVLKTLPPPFPFPTSGPFNPNPNPFATPTPPVHPAGPVVDHSMLIAAVGRLQAKIPNVVSRYNTAQSLYDTVQQRAKAAYDSCTTSADAVAELNALNSLSITQFVPMQGDPIALNQFTSVSVIVEPGDTLWQISKQVYGNTDFNHIVQQNPGITDPNMILVGQVITLTAPGTFTTGAVVPAMPAAIPSTVPRGSRRPQ